MSEVMPVCQNQSVYNAVKIKINNPQAKLPEGINSGDGNAEYNAVNIEVNNPELITKKKPVYSYPEAKNIVTYDCANIAPIDVPVIPIAYKTSYINSQMYINTDVDSPVSKKNNDVIVPPPNLTTQEAEKGYPDESKTFNGVSFQGAPAPKVVKDSKIQPAVDMDKVLADLNSSDYDVQAQQLASIYTAIDNNRADSDSYITVPVFSALIDIVEKDTSGMKGPDDEQNAIREKFILNEISRVQQLQEGKKDNEVELPFNLSEDDIAKAMNLNERELAERNKEYAIADLAILTKAYSDDFEKKTGNVVPLTDLPGVSSMVEVLKNSPNTSLKIAAIKSLVYINKPEYKSEISTILRIASSDKDRSVSEVAAAGAEYLESM